MALKADKLILVGAGAGVQDRDGELLAELSAADAERRIAEGGLDEACATDLGHMLKACRGGVSRAHLIPARLDGGILIDLFTHSGVGTMLTPRRPRSAARGRPGRRRRHPAPDRAAGRGRHAGQAPARGDRTRDRPVLGARARRRHLRLRGAVRLPARGRIGEMACLTVNPDQRETRRRRAPVAAHRGARARRRAQAPVRAHHAHHALVSQARFYNRRGRGSAAANASAMYNWQRRSQILIKAL